MVKNEHAKPYRPSGPPTSPPPPKTKSKMRDKFINSFARLMYAKNGVEEAIRRTERMDIKEIKEHNGEITVVTGRPGRVIGAKGAMYSEIKVTCGPFKIEEALSKSPLDEITDAIIMHSKMDGHYYE